MAGAALVRAEELVLKNFLIAATRSEGLHVRGALSVGILAQQQPKRGFSRTIGLTHGLEESFRAHNRAGSASAINLPSP